MLGKLVGRNGSIAVTIGHAHLNHHRRQHQRCPSQRIEYQKIKYETEKDKVTLAYPLIFAIKNHCAGVSVYQLFVIVYTFQFKFNTNSLLFVCLRNRNLIRNSVHCIVIK